MTDDQPALFVVFMVKASLGLCPKLLEDREDDRVARLLAAARPGQRRLGCTSRCA